MDVRVLCGFWLVLGLAGCDEIPIRIHVDTAETNLQWLGAINWTLDKLQPAVAVSQVDIPVWKPRRACSQAQYVNGTCVVEALAVEYCDALTLGNRYLEPVLLCKQGMACRRVEPAILEADLVVIVTTTDLKCLVQAAQAYVCHRDSFGRPLIGWINLCPNVLQDPEVQQADLNRLVLHEMLHVLGFERASFQQYQRCTGSSITPNFSCSTRHMTTISIDGNAYLNLPTPTRAYRDHYGCHVDDFPGIPLEGGTSASQGHHWNGYSFYQEVMAPDWVVTEGRLRVLSVLTLSVLQDSGWYRVNLSLAEPYEWGRSAGCSMARGDHVDSCPAVNNNNSRFLCTQDQVEQTSCGSDPLQTVVCAPRNSESQCPLWRNNVQSCQQPKGSTLASIGSSVCARHERLGLAYCTVQQCLGGQLYLWHDQWHACIDGTVDLKDGIMSCDMQACFHATNNTISRVQVGVEHRLWQLVLQTDEGRIEWMKSLYASLNDVINLCNNQLMVLGAATPRIGTVFSTFTVLELPGCTPPVDIIAGLATLSFSPAVTLSDGRVAAFRRVTNASAGFAVQSVSKGGFLLLMIVVGGLLMLVTAVISMISLALLVKQGSWTRPSTVFDLNAMDAQEGALEEESAAPIDQGQAQRTPLSLLSWRSLLEPDQQLDAAAATTQGMETARSRVSLAWT